MNSFLRKFIIGEWNLGISNQNFLELFSKVKQGETLTLDVKWMKHRRYASFFADPFIYSVNDKTVDVLAEEYLFKKNKGIISFCTIDRNSGKLTNRKKILEETCHLSYPFYDEDAGIIIPESFRNGNWASYKFDGDKAAEKRIITNLPIIDATPVFHNGKWYVFAVNQPKALSELLIYVADERYGEYRPHPLNPIKDDIRTSRSGGKIFEYEGNLYRLVQDSTHRYGEALHIMKITELTECAFNEEHFCDISISNPEKYPLGCHTLNFKNDFIVVDGFRERFRPMFAVYIIKIMPIFRKVFNK